MIQRHLQSSNSIRILSSVDEKSATLNCESFGFWDPEGWSGRMPLKLVDATVSSFDAAFEKFRSEAPKHRANLILFLADKDPATSLSWCPGLSVFRSPRLTLISSISKWQDLRLLQTCSLLVCLDWIMYMPSPRSLFCPIVHLRCWSGIPFYERFWLSCFGGSPCSFGWPGLGLWIEIFPGGNTPYLMFL